MKASMVALACLLLLNATCDAAGAGNDVACDDCTWLITTGESYLADPTNQQLLVQFMVTSVCPQLQEPLRQEVIPCPASARSYALKSLRLQGASRHYSSYNPSPVICLDYAPILVPTAVLWMKSNLSPGMVCSHLAMCPVTEGRVRNLPSSILQEMAAEDGLPCPVCMFMLAQLLTQIQDPGNQATIEQGALQMCALLEAPYQPDCHDNIKGITGRVFAVLADVSVVKACNALKACETDPQLVKQLAGPAAFADDRIQKLINDMRQLARQRAAGASAQCQECEMVAAELKSLLENPDTRRQIKAGIKAACGVLQAYEASCIELVDDNAELAFAMALQYVADPSATCAQLGMCPPLHVPTSALSRVRLAVS